MLLYTYQKMLMEDSLIINKNHGNSNLIKSCIIHLKKTFLAIVPKKLFKKLQMDIMEL
jgi:hypothetical protein